MRERRRRVRYGATPDMTMLVREAPPTGGWEASLDVRLALADGRTVVAGRAHRGPLQIQRPFYPEARDVCHLYLLHPPGGIVAGDELAVSLDCEAGARAVVTTPAATKVYRSPAPELVARQRVRATVAAGAALEWLPQETIVFDGARAALETTVELAAGASFVGWEVICLGRPACGEGFARGVCRQRFELFRSGRPLAVERARLDDEALRAPSGLRGAVASGTLLAAPAPREALDAIRAVEAPDGWTSATIVERGGETVLIARYLGASAAAGRELFARMWALLRPALLGRPAAAPRIWST